MHDNFIAPTGGLFFTCIFQCVQNLDKDIEQDTRDNKKIPIEDSLKGKTLQVYTYMLKKKEPVGVREVQRDLGFSSPSVANYHIEKLIEFSLVNQDEYGRYFVIQKIQVGILQAFVNIGGLSVPRLSFYAAFFTTILVSYIILNFSNLDIYAIGFAMSGAIAFWFESIRIWRRKSFS